MLDGAHNYLPMTFAVLAWRRAACVVLALAMLGKANACSTGSLEKNTHLDTPTSKSLDSETVRMVLSKIMRASDHSLLGTARIISVRGRFKHPEINPEMSMEASEGHNQGVILCQLKYKGKHPLSQWRWTNPFWLFGCSSRRYGNMISLESNHSLLI